MTCMLFALQLDDEPQRCMLDLARQALRQAGSSSSTAAHQMGALARCQPALPGWHSSSR